MQGPELPDALRDLFRRRNLYRLNVVNPHGTGSTEEMLEVCLNESTVTVADWGLYHNDATQSLIDPSSEPPVTVTEDAFNDQYRDDITGDVDWDAVRDTLHEELMSEDTKIKAGNAKGVIKRFLVDAEAGDLVVYNTPRGQLFLVFDGPAVFDPGQPQTDYDEDHVFRRPVRVVRDDDGEPLAVDQDHLPEPLKPNRLTMTTVGRDGKVTLLGYAQGLTALVDAHDREAED